MCIRDRRHSTHDEAAGPWHWDPTWTRDATQGAGGEAGADGQSSNQEGTAAKEGTVARAAPCIEAIARQNQLAAFIVLPESEWDRLVAESGSIGDAAGSAGTDQPIPLVDPHIVRGRDNLGGVEARSGNDRDGDQEPTQATPHDAPLS